jgi:mono/diheme cytochrome c family protein
MRRAAEDHQTDGRARLGALFATRVRFHKTIPLLLVALSLAATASLPDGSWLEKVPQTEHQKTNPYRDQPDAIAAGRRVYEDHCKKCHGENAEGTKKRPPLRSDIVQQIATEGDLHWLLVNGYMKKGMPSWSKLPDPQLWQLITYLKSLQ